MSIVIGAGITLGPGWSVTSSNPTNLWAWGGGTYGKLGLGNTVDRSSPVQVGALGTWSKVVRGRWTTAAIQTDGTLWSWGDNDSGLLGLEDVVNRSSPVQVGALTSWAAVAVGNNSMAAIKTDGTLWTWGTAYYGWLGNNNGGVGSTKRSSPIQVGALTTWSKITSNASSIAAIKTDGTLWTWGNNYAGALGVGDKIKRSSPVQVGALTTWSNISGDTAGQNSQGSFIATKTDGTLWAWGYNQTGQLGLGDTVKRSSPVQVGTLTTWAVGKIGFSFGLGIKTAGSLWTWGYNNSGQLGSGIAGNLTYNSPVQVGTLTDWWSSWDKSTAGGKTGLAIKSDGTLWNWGYNAAGQLGRNNTANTSSPVQLGSLTTWTSISAAGGAGGGDTGVLAIASH